MSQTPIRKKVVKKSTNLTPAEAKIKAKQVLSESPALESLSQDSDRDTLILQLRSEIEQLKQNITAPAPNQSEFEQLQAELAQLRADEVSAREQQNRIISQLHQQTDTVSQLTTELGAVRSDLVRRTQQLEATRRETERVAGLDTAKRDLEERCQRLEFENNSLRSERQLLSSHYQGKENPLDALQLEKQNVLDLNEKLRVLTERNAELEFQLHSLKSEALAKEEELIELQDKKIQELLQTLEEKDAVLRERQLIIDQFVTWNNLSEVEREALKLPLPPSAMPENAVDVAKQEQDDSWFNIF